MNEFEQALREWDIDALAYRPMPAMDDDVEPAAFDNKATADREKSIEKIRETVDLAVERALAPDYMKEWVNVDLKITDTLNVKRAKFFAQIEQVLHLLQSHEWRTESKSEFLLSPEIVANIRTSIPAFVATGEFHFSNFEFGKADEQISDERVSELVRDQLRMMFAAYARHLTQIREQFVPISCNGEFLQEIDIMMQARIPYQPRRFGPFSDYILLQMQNLDVAMSIAGSWGAFEFDSNGDIAMRISLSPLDAPVSSAASAEIEQF
ncbi:hypothetical protein [Methylobacterium sp. WL9]|uniref:hypothetical protein n=1 Tax=Methylobacterium sp. WL9 TaxID=2603898 RepID=UPI0011CAE04F|nr:hypothetical protein [Methylobacterium sp. WL9]TXN21287.1 hypothetical protein FV217_14930 [Methylobacterium sp. WL9]